MLAQYPNFNVLVCDVEASRQLLYTALTRTEGVLCLCLGAWSPWWITECVCPVPCRLGGQQGVSGFPLFIYLCFGSVSMTALDGTVLRVLLIQ